MIANLYQPLGAQITDIIDESPTIKSFVVKPESPFKFKTGQFVELTLPGEGEAPFTPSSSPNQTEHMEITIMKAGRVTGLLHECSPGQMVGIRGPFGNGYPVDSFKGKEVYIVGGGVGLMLGAQQIEHGLDRRESFEGNLDEDRVPTGHRAVP